jgi:hypothetical protein
MTEIYLCNVCSCQETLRRNGRGQPGAVAGGQPLGLRGGARAGNDGGGGGDDDTTASPSKWVGMGLVVGEDPRHTAEAHSPNHFRQDQLRRQQRRRQQHQQQQRRRRQQQQQQQQHEGSSGGGGRAARRAGTPIAKVVGAMWKGWVAEFGLVTGVCV